MVWSTQDSRVWQNGSITKNITKLMIHLKKIDDEYKYIFGC